MTVAGVFSSVLLGEEPEFLTNIDLVFLRENPVVILQTPKLLAFKSGKGTESPGLALEIEAGLQFELALRYLGRSAANIHLPFYRVTACLDILSLPRKSFYT